MEITDGALITAVGQVELSDGRLLVYPAPNVVSFNLVEARAHQKRVRKMSSQTVPGRSGLTDNLQVKRPKLSSVAHDGSDRISI
jgi:hypothetical protein